MSLFSPVSMVKDKNPKTFSSPSRISDTAARNEFHTIIFKNKGRLGFGVKFNVDNEKDSQANESNKVRTKVINVTAPASDLGVREGMYITKINSISTVSWSGRKIAYVRFFLVCPVSNFPIKRQRLLFDIVSSCMCCTLSIVHQYNTEIILRSYEMFVQFL